MPLCNQIVDSVLKCSRCHMALLPVFVSVCLTAIAASAENTATPQSANNSAAATTDSLSARLDKVEAFQARLEKVSPFIPGISAYASVGYNYDEDNTSEFYVKCARFDIKGSLGAKLDYRFLFDFYKFKCYDVRISYKPLKEINITAGHFKVPFTIGNGRGPLTEEFITTPLVIQRLMGFTDECGITGGSGRDIGVSLTGTLWRHKGLDVVSYALGVFNGNGSNTKDDNTSKDVTAKLSLRPLKGLELSGSIYHGEYGPGFMRRNRWSVGGEYAGSVLLARGEYVAGDTGGRNSDGCYAQLGVKTRINLTPLVRFDSFTSDTDADATERIYSVGLDWHPIKHLRLQGNYSRRTFCGFSGENDRNQFHFVVTAIL
ncbi:MAG: porin [Muribaculaceae bacterium]